MAQKCMLCGEDLNKYPTNREHYVPQVLIRSFKTLCINKGFDWAVRTNECSIKNDDVLSVPLSRHKEWAVVRVHTKCNLDASGMCQDLRYIIDHIDQDIPVKFFKRPMEYYAALWNVPVDSITITINDRNSTIERLKTDCMLLYTPALLDCGRLVIASNHIVDMNEYQHDTIRIGKKSVMK